MRPALVTSLDWNLVNFKALYKHWLLVLIIFWLIPCPSLALAVAGTLFDSMGQPKIKHWKNMGIWVKDAYNCNYLHYRDNYLDQDIIFAKVRQGGSMIQIAKVPVTNERHLETVVHCSALLEGKTLPGWRRSHSKWVMKFTLLTLSVRMYLWETNMKYSSHLRDLAGKQREVGYLIMRPKPLGSFGIGFVPG